MAKGKNRAVWITDEYARLFLGSEARAEKSRWVIVGELVDADEPHGVWLSIDRIEERRQDGKDVLWKVEPRECLILWVGIITIQHLGPNYDTSKLGFQAADKQ